MAIRTELTLRLKNTPGALARLCQALADEKVNVLAMNLESSGVLHLVAENPVHAAGLLRSRDYTLEERDVLFIQLPNRPGTGPTTGDRRPGRDGSVARPGARELTRRQRSPPVSS